MQDGEQDSKDYIYTSTLYMGNVVFFCIVMCLEEAATELAVWKIEGYEI